MWPRPLRGRAVRRPLVSFSAIARAGGLGRRAGDGRRQPAAGRPARPRRPARRRQRGRRRNLRRGRPVRNRAAVPPGWGATCWRWSASPPARCTGWTRPGPHPRWLLSRSPRTDRAQSTCPERLRAGASCRRASGAAGWSAASGPRAASPSPASPPGSTARGTGELVRAHRRHSVRPAFGERYRLPELAATLEGIAAEGPGFFYRGPVAEAIAAASWLTVDDLAGYQARWVAPLTARISGLRGGRAAAASTRGVVALSCAVDPGRSGRRPARAGGRGRPGPRGWSGHGSGRRRRDHPAGQEYVAARRAEPPGRSPSRPAGRSVCAVDGDGDGRALLQSLYEAFGSGVVAGGTGIVLNDPRCPASPCRGRCWRCSPLPHVDSGRAHP